MRAALFLAGKVLQAIKGTVLFSHAGERRAIAFQLLAALEKYDQELGPLLKGYDPERYTDLSRQFDQLRLYVASLPELSVPWVSVLISRAEMTYALFKARGDARASETAKQV